MLLNTSLALSTLVVSCVRSAPLVPAIFSNQIVAHEFIEPHQMPGQISGETIVISSSHPRPSFVDWTSSSSSSYVDRPAAPSTTSTTSNFKHLAAKMSKEQKKKMSNITKHVLWEVGMPLKRSQVNDSEKFYTLKVTDLQKGPFKSESDIDKNL